jgi:hypothetical protein
MPDASQPVTDNSIKIRQLSHYQFSWVAGDPGQPGTYDIERRVLLFGVTPAGS